MSTFIPPTDEILNVIKYHFAKEWSVNPKDLTIDSIETYVDKNEIKYHLDFSIDWGGSYDSYWGEITHAEVLADMRDMKIKSIIL